MPLETDVRLARGRTREDARFTAPPSLAGLPDSYGTTLEEIKSHLQSARIRALLAANPIVIEAYWHTGKIILQRQQEAAWGAKVIDRLSAYLDLAEDMALRQIPMTMQDWETRLNSSQPQTAKFSRTLEKSPPKSLKRTPKPSLKNTEACKTAPSNPTSTK